MSNLIVVVLSLLVTSTPHFVDARYEWGAWSRATPCSVTCGKGTTSRTRYCNYVGASTINASLQGAGESCTGPTEVNSPCFELACPEEPECNCGCEMKRSSGNLTSVLTYEASRVCEWRISVPQGSKIKLVVKDLQLRQGNLQIRLGGDKEKVLRRLFETQSSEERFPFQLISDGNSANVTLMFYKTMVALTGTIKLHAYYEEMKPPTLPAPNDGTHKHQALNTSAIIGITACGVVIFLASFILIYRYCKRAREKSDESIEVADDNDNGSSSSSSRSRSKGTPSKKSSFASGMQQRLLSSGKSKPGKPLTPESKDSAYESDHRRPLVDNNGAYPRPEIYQPERVAASTGRTLPYTASFWPMQPRRYSSEVDYRHSLNQQHMLNQQKFAQIAPAPMNIHMPHPQLGYMIKQAQLSYPSQIVPTHLYQQQQLQQQQFQQPPQPQPHQLQQRQHQPRLYSETMSEFSDSSVPSSPL